MPKLMIGSEQVSGSFDKASNISYDNTSSLLGGGTVQSAIDELASSVNTINSSLSNINKLTDKIGLNDAKLSNHSIGRSLSFNDLIKSNNIVFFTNWDDGTNFPCIFGSGILIPALDANNKYIIYICNAGFYYGIKLAGPSNINWYKVGIIS